MLAFIANPLPKHAAYPDWGIGVTEFGPCLSAEYH